MTALLENQTLLIDADDTLWENNVYYERAFEEFVEFLAHEHLSPAEIREVLDRFEIVNGFGARAFARSLVETFIEVGGPGDEATQRRVDEFGLRILEIEMEVMPGVEETLAALGPHHALYLFTKGDDEEQRLKIQRSGIGQAFDAHIIAAEKKTHTYAEVVDALELDPGSTWMIGNSTKSDIVPALEAGLNAIYIPHPMTWHLEHIDMEHHPDWAGRYVEIEQFGDLRTLFHHSS